MSWFQLIKCSIAFHLHHRKNNKILSSLKNSQNNLYQAQKMSMSLQTFPLVTTCSKTYKIGRVSFPVLASDILYSNFWDTESFFVAEYIVVSFVWTSKITFLIWFKIGDVFLNSNNKHPSKLLCKPRRFDRLQVYKFKLSYLILS